ncbi:MAG: hypothetical protein PUI85_03775 [Eubacteriales bacterium]|nr:hypothetical protein [Eubacteriales bacterium]MDY3332279.1 hypothetical protein [Gallibacter sp.]
MNNELMKYKDIIDLENFNPKHPRMERIKRAAQFAPFAALTGHEDAIIEKGRLTEEKPTLDNDQIVEIERNLTQISMLGVSDLTIYIKYFEQDLLKKGGLIKEYMGEIIKLNDFEKNIFLKNNALIDFENILDISILGDLFV